MTWIKIRGASGGILTVWVSSAIVLININCELQNRIGNSEPLCSVEREG